MGVSFSLGVCIMYRSARTKLGKCWKDFQEPEAEEFVSIQKSLICVKTGEKRQIYMKISGVFERISGVTS